MSSRLERLRARTNGYTVTPRQYVYVAYAALVALTLIVLSGAAVRLTGSGLGCPDWPRCYGHAYPPLNTHAVIEFSNRLITGPVAIAAGAAWLLALRRHPYRRDLMWLGALLPLGVVGQAVLGGFTVRGALDYGWVMGHFALSMLILLAAAILAWRAGHESALLEIEAEVGRGERGVGATAPEPAPVNGSVASTDGSPASTNGATPPVVAGAAMAAAARTPSHGASGDPAAVDPARERPLILSLRGLVALGALTIFAGTAATAAGPHAGGSPGQRINRLDFDGHGTMDFVIHRHGEIALLFGLASLAVWWFARRRWQARPTVQRSLTVLCVLLALQGVVGLDQYKTHLPTQLVWVHVGLACGTWLAAIWAACAAGALAPRRSAITPERTASTPIAAPRPVEFPGN